MFSVTRLIHFCYGHRLLDYEGKCRNMHGHNGLVEITIKKDKLDKLGMVMDFEEIKATVQKWVDQELDHKMILHEQDPLVAALKAGGQPMVLLKGNPTAEAIARMIYDYAVSRRLPVSEVKLWETRNSYATYRG